METRILFNARRNVAQEHAATCPMLNRASKALTVCDADEREDLESRGYTVTRCKCCKAA